MFGRLLSIFRRPTTPAAATPRDVEPELVRFQNGVYEATAGNEDIIAGYTLRDRTPWMTM